MTLEQSVVGRTNITEEEAREIFRRRFERDWSVEGTEAEFGRMLTNFITAQQQHPDILEEMLKSFNTQEE